MHDDKFKTSTCAPTAFPVFAYVQKVSPRKAGIRDSPKQIAHACRANTQDQVIILLCPEVHIYMVHLEEPRTNLASAVTSPEDGMYVCIDTFDGHVSVKILKMRLAPDTEGLAS